jgi:DNA-binding transcriptional LysR family regulator
VAAELGSLSTVKHMAAQGFGIAIASTAAIRSAVEAGRWWAFPCRRACYTPLEVILLKDKFRSRLVNTFADFVTEEIGRMCATEKA